MIKPMSSAKLTATLVVVLLGLLAILGATVAKERMFPQSGDPRERGNPKADLKIVEYIDYQCKACGDAVRMLDDLEKKYPGKTHLQVRFHPLVMHPHGMLSALYAQCAVDQGKFWDFHHKLFEKQAEWSPKPNPRADFYAYAAETRLDRPKLEACVDDPATEEKVRQELKASGALGVRATPSIFINEEMIVGAIALKEKLKSLFPQDPEYAQPTPQTPQHKH